MADLLNGYRTERDGFACLYCGERFTRGVIYTVGGVLCDAERAAALHVSASHGSAFEALLALDKKQTGITDTQRQFLHHFYLGTPDNDIARLTGTSPSTVRFQRYSFRERVKHARVLIALGELLEAKNATPDFPTVHDAATQVDERYMTTESEEEKLIKPYLVSREPLVLARFPTKEKRKLIILRIIITFFEKNRRYTEKEVNAILSEVFDDYVTLRRYLIEYCFMDRLNDGSEYWVK